MADLHRRYTVPILALGQGSSSSLGLSVPGPLHAGPVPCGHSSAGHHLRYGNSCD